MKLSALTYFVHVMVLLAGLNRAYGQTALDQYLKEAAENHPGLKSSYKEYMAALEKVDQTGTLPDPQLGFGYFISPVETRVGPQRFKLSISQMFPWFGTLDQEKSLASSLAKSKFEIFQGKKNALFRDVKKQYFEIDNLTQINGLISENIELLNSLKNLATQRFENNQGSLVEVIQIGITINEVENDLVLNNDQLITLRNNFNLIIGRDTESVIELDDFDPSSTSNPFTIADIEGHPTLKNIQYEVEAYDEKIALTRLQGKPQIGFGLDYVVVSDRSDVDISDNGQNAFMPQLTMSLPLFRKKYKAATREAELLKQSRQELYEERKLNMTVTYENRLYELNKARQEIDLYRKQGEETQNAVALLLSAYAGNQTNFEELLKMQQLLLQYKVAEQNAIKDLRISQAELEYFTNNDI